jgi:hypothetical protein
MAKASKPKVNNYDQTSSYLALRKAVGWIGILLPFVLVLGMLLIFNGEAIQKTISQYYYTGMRDVFTGALCAIALFLFYYKGYSKWDNWAGNLAGFFAIGIAWFPTSSPESVNIIGTVHLICASLFFIVLAGFSMVLFTMKAPHPTNRKLKRNIIYIICGIIMIVCLIAISIYFNISHDPASGSHFVFWAESMALIAFGISWLTKGGTLLPDK